MNKTVENLIYLLSCAVNEKAPDAEQIGAMDLNELYKLSKEQTLRGAVYIALRNAGVKNDKFFMAYNKAVRKNVSLPAWLAAEAEKAHVNLSRVLQDALKEKLNIA